jgi:IS5 family transposase
MQHWYSLSDQGMIAALIGVETKRRVERIDLITDQIRYKSTNIAFRHLPEKQDLG